MQKVETTGRIIAIGKKSVRIKIANDDSFVINVPVFEHERQACFDILNKDIVVSMEDSIDKVKGRLKFDIQFSIGCQAEDDNIKSNKSYKC